MSGTDRCGFESGGDRITSEKGVGKKARRRQTATTDMSSNQLSLHVLDVVSI